MNTKHFVTLIAIAMLVSSFAFAQSGTKKTTTTTTTTTVVTTTTDAEEAAAMAPAIAESKATVVLPEQFANKTVGQNSVTTRPQVAPLNEELATRQPVQVVERQIIVEKPVYVQASPVYVQTPVYVQEPVYVAPAPVVSLGYSQVGRHGAFSVGISSGYGYGSDYSSGHCYGNAPGYGYGSAYENHRLAMEQASYRAQVRAADIQCQMSGQNRPIGYGGGHNRCR